MKHLTEIDWSLIWYAIKDIIIPYSGKLTFNTILFLIIGLLLSVVYCFCLFKTSILKRKPKYYNWSVKLYIPILIGVFIYIFGQIGFIRGVYKILDKEKNHIVTSTYSNTLAFAFKSEQSKNTFIRGIQTLSKGTKDISEDLMVKLKNASASYNSGISLIDNNKDKLSNYLIEKHGDDIYKVSLFGMLKLAEDNANVNELLTYNELSAGIDFLLEVGYKDIEIAVKKELITWFSSLLSSQYYSMVKSLLIFLLIVMSVPLIEFFVYKKWIDPTLTKK